MYIYMYIYMYMCIYIYICKSFSHDKWVLGMEILLCELGFIAENCGKLSVVLEINWWNC